MDLERRQFLAISIATLMASQARGAEPARVITPITLGAAINKAGRQRMLTQRMAKAYAMQVLAIMPERALSLLDQSRKLFELQLLELATMVPNEAIQATLDKLAVQWASYRQLLLKPPQKSALHEIMQTSEACLAVAHTLTGLYEKQAGTPAGQLVNISGRQRMLSQRMAKCYLIIQSGAAVSGVNEQMSAAHKEFVSALATLNAANENTAEIRTDLGLANTQWLFFEQALSGNERVKEIALRNVVTTSERILEVMDSLTGRYEKLVRS